jgi:putative ABC transport system permease protein
MGRLVLAYRVVVADLGRRRTESVLLLLAITAAMTTLTLGLVLHGVISQPYEQTRAATVGPDVVANLFPGFNATGVTQGELANLTALEHASGVTGHSGPYPVTWAALRFHGVTGGAETEGRDQALTSVDQPKLTQGSWIRPGGVVVERTFATALGVHVGDSLTLGGRTFRVAGIAVTAAFTPFPQICSLGCDLNSPDFSASNTGLFWLTRTDARSLATSSEPVVYFMNLRLKDPASADAFANAYDNTYANSPHTPNLNSWQYISQRDGQLVQGEQLVMLVGSWLLGVLAIAAVAVLVGGRMAGQMRRVGLLKAVGGTPGLVARVLLAEYLLLALVAAAAGLLIGWLVAPLLTRPGAGLLGTAGPPPFTLATAGIVVAAAVAVAVVAAFVPAVRAARISTVRALADAARSPRRHGSLIAISARLPVPLLIAVRIAARRPRRVALSVLSIAVTVTGIVAVMFAHARLTAYQAAGSGALDNPRNDRANQVLMVLTVMLLTLAAVNAVFITQATVADARRASAVTRALGATPGQVTTGLSVAQLLPALAGAILGIPGGIGLYAAVRHGSAMTYPPLWWLIAVVPGTVGVVAVLIAIPAHLGARRPVAGILQSEAA